ncbi:STAS domain-containing protein [Patescibacteria group bacterium]|nr:STAS domain-containing protein [Patescibacteria group bacterium]
MATFIELTASDLPGFAPTAAKVVSFKGQLDESNVDDQSKKIYDILEGVGENFNLLLDFKDLEYMNSKAVGYLTDWYTKLTDLKGGVFVVQPKENILDILQVVGLTQLVQVYATMDEARLALNKAGAPAAASAATPEATAAPAATPTPTMEATAPVAAMPEATPAPVTTEPAPIAPTPEAVTPDLETSSPTPETPTVVVPVESTPEPSVESTASPETPMLADTPTDTPVVEAPESTPQPQVTPETPTEPTPEEPTV